MICPNCYEQTQDMYKTKCLATRTYQDENTGKFWVERAHICSNPECECRFKTTETVSED